MEEVAKVKEVEWYAVQLVHAEKPPATPVLAIEFSPYGDLNKNIRKFQGHPSCFWRMLLQVTSVFAYMPKLNHRDIKPENILLFPSKGGTEVNFKLGDFGLASNNGDTTMWAGTATYMPPEARTCPKKVDRQSDVFAIALTVLNMVIGNGRGGEVNKMACRQKATGMFFKDTRCTWEEGTALIFQDIDTIIAEYSMKYPDTNGKARLSELKNLLKYMTHPRPEERITFDQLSPLLQEAGQSLNGHLLCPVGLVK